MSFCEITSKLKVRLLGFADVSSYLRFKVGPTSWFYLLQWNSLKNHEQCFSFRVESSFCEILRFCPNLSRHVGKRLDNKAKVNFKNHVVTDSITNIYNKHIAQYLKKKRQPDHEIRSVNRIENEKYFPWKIIHKMW